MVRFPTCITCLACKNLQVWRHGVKILSIIAEDDVALPSSVYKEMEMKIPVDKRHTIQSVFYPGAGHLIEPPYTPLCRACYLDEQFGVEPIGLFWAMVPSAKHRKPTRLLKKDVTVPFDITISAWLNHVHLKSIGSSSNSPGVIAATQVKRWYLQEGVQRIPDVAELLSQHPQASDGGIGVIGTSFGGAVANMLASFCRKIWRQDVKILSLVGEDDRTVSPMLYRELIKKVPGDKVRNIQTIYYPGAGHIIEPPYVPLCREHYLDNKSEKLFLFGGEMKGNAVAQEDSWRRILEHFNKFLAKRNTDGNNVVS
ncbi:acyl-coenzyme A thioesterase 2, mitochondrial-like [Haliotis rubra]|uniref:acyl-coenzyme A thioesterase 2, mitochondrial-like n=1 Tax=Haliotis rubra TaxID=36100 RepID=UPI001EE51385|nr:acyl-coenzyme A thioesterase 2, mitochondrial-like [Haliotis rubra]